MEEAHEANEAAAMALEQELKESKARVQAMRRRAKSAAVEASSDDSGGVAELEASRAGRDVPLPLMVTLVRNLWQWGDRSNARRLLPVALARVTAARAALARRAVKEANSTELSAPGSKLPHAVRLAGTVYGEAGESAAAAGHHPGSPHDAGDGDPAALAAASVLQMHTRGTGAAAAGITPSSADVVPGVPGAGAPGVLQAATGALAATGQADLGHDPTGDASRPGSRAVGMTSGAADRDAPLTQARLPAPSAILPPARAERDAAEALGRMAAELVLLRRMLALEAALAETRARRGGAVAVGESHAGDSGVASGAGGSGAGGKEEEGGKEKAKETEPQKGWLDEDPTQLLPRHGLLLCPPVDFAKEGQAATDAGARHSPDVVPVARARALAAAACAAAKHGAGDRAPMVLASATALCWHASARADALLRSMDASLAEGRARGTKIAAMAVVADGASAVLAASSVSGHLTGWRRQCEAGLALSRVLLSAGAHRATVSAARRALEAAELGRGAAAEEAVGQLTRERAPGAKGCDECWQEAAALALQCSAGGMWTSDEGPLRAGPTERNLHERSQSEGGDGSKPGHGPAGRDNRAVGPGQMAAQEAACLHFDAVATYLRAQMASAAAAQAQRDSLRDPPPSDPVARAAHTRAKRRLELAAAGAGRVKRGASAIGRQRRADSEDDSEDEEGGQGVAGGGGVTSDESGDPWGPAASGPDEASLRALRAWAGGDAACLALVHLCALRYDRSPAQRLDRLEEALRCADAAAEHAARARQCSAAAVLDAAGDVDVSRLQRGSNRGAPAGSEPLLVARWGGGAAFLVARSGASSSSSSSSSPRDGAGEGESIDGSASSAWASPRRTGAWVWCREGRAGVTSGGQQGRRNQDEGTGSGGSGTSSGAAQSFGGGGGGGLESVARG